LKATSATADGMPFVIKPGYRKFVKFTGGFVYCSACLSPANAGRT